MRSAAAQWELDGPRITGPMTSLNMLIGKVELMRGDSGFRSRWREEIPISGVSKSSRIGCCQDGSCSATF
jgi:hypothetical protein